VKYRFARGWIDALEVDEFGVAFSRSLATAPELSLLRSLTFLEDAYEEPGEYEPGPDVPDDTDGSPAMYPLVKAKHLGNVRVLQVGEQVDGFLQPQAECFYNGRIGGGAVAGIVKVMPRLEELYLLARDVDLNQLFSLKTLDNLRILQVYHLNRYPLSRLAKNPSLGKLTHLLCHPHAVEDFDEMPITMDGLRALVRATNLPSLTHLQLRTTTFGDRGIDEIVRSGILKRLKFLDLRGGTVTDDGAKALAECADVKNLQVLDLSRNKLTKDGIAQLKATGIEVRALNMWQGEIGDDEVEFLFEGDIE
jgi:hypothetical protein